MEFPALFEDCKRISHHERKKNQEPSVSLEAYVAQENISEEKIEGRY